MNFDADCARKLVNKIKDTINVLCNVISILCTYHPHRFFSSRTVHTWKRNKFPISLIFVKYAMKYFEFCPPEVRSTKSIFHLILKCIWTWSWMSACFKIPFISSDGFLFLLFVTARITIFGLKRKKPTTSSTFSSCRASLLSPHLFRCAELLGSLLPGSVTAGSLGRCSSCLLAF